MNQSQKDKDINPKDLPQSEVFAKKEVFQYPQPADFGKPLPPANSEKATNIKEDKKTSKEEGLNEENSTGDVGAFEGFEDHSK